MKRPTQSIFPRDDVISNHIVPAIVFRSIVPGKHAVKTKVARKHFTVRTSTSGYIVVQVQATRLFSLKIVIHRHRYSFSHEL